MAATTEIIAQKLGLSRATVSRVLNGTGRISQKTKERVLAMADTLGYTPNKAARALVKNKVYRIAVVIFSEPLFFWSQVRRGIDYAFEELRHFGLDVQTYVTDINNPAEQAALMEKLAGECDAIALAPNIPSIMRKPIDQAADKGIPVVTFNSDVPGSARICYVGSNYLQCGRLAGELLEKMMGSKGDVAVFTVAPGIETIGERVRGFRQYVADYPGIRIARTCELNRMGDNAYETARNVLEESEGISGVFVGSGVLGEVARAVEDLGRSWRIRLVGYDLNGDIRTHILNGVIDAVIVHEPFIQGYFPVAMLHKLLAENTPPQSQVVTTKAEAVFGSNVEYYMNEEIRYMELR